MGVSSRRLAKHEGSWQCLIDHLEDESTQANTFYSKYIAAAEWQRSTISFNMRFDEIFTKYIGSATEWVRIFFFSILYQVFCAFQPWSSWPAMGSSRAAAAEAPCPGTLDSW